MNVRCAECQSVFRVDPAKVPPGGVRARCSVCGAVMQVGGDTTQFVEIAAADVESASAAVTSAATPAAPVKPTWTSAVPQAILDSDAASAPEYYDPSPVEPAPAVEPESATMRRATPMAPPAAPPRAPTPEAMSVAAPAVVAGVVPAPTPSPIPSPAVVPPRPRMVPPVRASSTMLTPPIPGAPLRVPAPPIPPRAAAPTAPVLPPRVAPPIPPGAGVVKPPMAPPVRPVAPAEHSGKRPVNPFLAQDPNLKGRRLARALVSDMVAYLPDRREQGLRDGTLKALFKEEIRKSYEEYIDQVGKEFAESTTHFEEALNDLLAGGQKMF